MALSSLHPFLDRVRPLRRIEYDRLVEAGLLADEKVELIRGLMVRMSPQGAPHANAVQNLTRMLVHTLAAVRAVVRVQLPILVGEDSEPEPDIAVAPPGSYKESHPSTAYLVAEVADSSVVKDRREKGVLYAEAGILEYWIVNTQTERVEVHTEIAGGVYTRVTPHRSGESIVLVSFPDVQISVDEIFR